MVFQSDALLPWRTVLDNVALGLQIAGRPQHERQDLSQYFIDLVGLTGFEHHYPHELSGGMRQRVNLCRAWAIDPQILLMDEPFAALDEITRFKLNADLLELWSGQRLTVIFVTHSVYESVFLSNRICVMAARPGRVIREIAINAPYPRDEGFRTSPVYNDFCRQVSGLLHEAMGAGG